MNSSYADVDGVRIHCIDHGGDGPDLLLVHATGFHARVWDPFVPRLRERFRVCAIDQRGHGDSDKPNPEPGKPETGYAWENFGRDVLAAVEALGLVSPRGVGHSAGGAALVMAEDMRPGTLAELVAMDPVIFQPIPDPIRDAVENPMAANARRRRARWESPDKMMERLRSGTPLASWREEFLRAYVVNGLRPVEDGTYELKCPPEIEAKVYEGSGRHGAWDALGRLQCPTLLLVGEHSHMWSGPRGPAAAGRIPHGSLSTVRGGHFFPMEYPDETLAKLLDFL